MTSNDQATPQDTAVERRVALRRGAAVLAGAAGLTAAAAATASAANAAPNDPIVLGQNNTSAASPTSVTSSSPTGTLALANTGSGAPLRVAVEPGPAGLPSATSAAGDHHSTDNDENGFAYPAFTHVTGTSDAAPATWGFLYTDVWAVQPIAVIPQRALDTRSAAGRSRVVNPAGNFDSAGRLLGGHTITLSLSDFAFGVGSVIGNLTVTGALTNGFVTVFGVNPRPATSSINYLANQTLANLCFSGFSFTGDDIIIRIFASTTTHVLFDVTGFAVGSNININEDILPVSEVTLAGRTRRIDPAKAPAWFRQQAQHHNR